MGKFLVIVESPAKVRTIGKILGKDYLISATMGHVRDLPKNRMGFKVDENLVSEIDYVVIDGKKQTIKDLKSKSKNVDLVYLATDPDREGEAIAWHVVEELKIDLSNLRRVVFNEITPDAVKGAFASPRDINRLLVDAQQARRLVDRIVGFPLSRYVTNNITGYTKLSAGRVQSVALQLIIDRENKIEKFKSQKYWQIKALLSCTQNNIKGDTFSAILQTKKSLKTGKGSSVQNVITELEEVEKIKIDLGTAKYIVKSINVKEKHSSPPLPFITTTLQREASVKYRFNVNRTMRIAQQLYEGISIQDGDQEGLITYMRTDSRVLSKNAKDDIKKYISSNFGSEYVGSVKGKKIAKVRGAQEAHEAIRPTAIFRTPSSLRKYLDSDQYKIYELIWNRTVSSQMADALYSVTTVDINANSSTRDYLFKASGSQIKFDGFKKLYISMILEEDDNESDTKLPVLHKGEILSREKLDLNVRETKPPPRFSESDLIRELESEGIGRPSTYASIVSKIRDQMYVTLEKNRFIPTKLGVAVSSILTRSFTDIVNVNFTSDLENSLDAIATGEMDMPKFVGEFDNSFKESVKLAHETAEKIDMREESGMSCKKCGNPLLIIEYRGAKFLGCKGFPECKYSEPMQIGVKCPQCWDEQGGQLVERGSKRGVFYACNKWKPSGGCNYISNGEISNDKTCSNCDSKLLKDKKGELDCIYCNRDNQSSEVAIKVDI
tara:strand:- start:18442 stop:20607 length:2166 start_codon:yes stop_codon:yes gene_type:complete